jgi:hypothetical protein
VREGAETAARTRGTDGSGGLRCGCGGRSGDGGVGDGARVLRKDLIDVGRAEVLALRLVVLEYPCRTLAQQILDLLRVEVRSRLVLTTIGESRQQQHT